MKASNTKKVLLLCSLFALGSCASNFDEEKKLLLKEEKKDLVSSFEINKENVDADNFQEKELSEVPVVPKVEVKKIEPVKKNKKIGKSQPVKVETATVESKSVEAAPSEIVEKITGAYPADYPKDYVQYDSHSKPIWSQFKPFFFKGEQTIMSVSYLGVTAGYITITSKNVMNINNKVAYNYHARFKSSDSYSYFYWLDDQLNTFVEKDTFLPIKYTLIQREKKQDVDDLQLFDFQKLRTYTFYKRVKQDSNKDEKLNVYIPKYAQDSFSALQFVRGLPLKKGDKYDFPVITRGKVWLLKVEVMGTETIDVMDKETSAIKIKAETHFPGVLKKSGDIFFWYSNDELRRLMKFQAKVKIGSLHGEMVEYKAGERVK